MTWQPMHAGERARWALLQRLQRVGVLRRRARTRRAALVVRDARTRRRQYVAVGRRARQRAAERRAQARRPRARDFDGLDAHGLARGHGDDRSRGCTRRRAAPRRADRARPCRAERRRFSNQLPVTRAGVAASSRASRAPIASPQLATRRLP